MSLFVLFFGLMSGCFLSVPVGTDRGLGCIGTLFGVLGLLFLVAFLFLLLAGGMLVAM